MVQQLPESRRNRRHEPSVIRHAHPERRPNRLYPKLATEAGGGTADRADLGRQRVIA
jgi:hypothetical protein